MFGPGPGDPRDTADARIVRLRELIAARLESRRPMLAVCLSHQVLAQHAGLPIAALDAPHQGVQHSVDVFGVPATIGFYNTFAARSVDLGGTPRLGLEVSAHEESGIVHALRGPGVASVQGHLESVLSMDGLATLDRLVGGLLDGQASWKGRVRSTRTSAAS